MMKTQIVFCSLMIIVSCLGQGIIIDHTCTHIDEIPPSYIDQVKSYLREKLDL